jgi:adenine deaminase
MLKQAYKLGIRKDIDPFLTLSFLSLPVIPEIRLTSRGLYDVSKATFLEI